MLTQAAHQQPVIPTGENSPYLYENIRRVLTGAANVDTTREFPIEFDRWHLGDIPSLIRRGELVISRDTSPKRTLLGVKDRPLVSLEELGELVASDPAIETPGLVHGGALYFQRFLGYTPCVGLYTTGKALVPTLEHVEVRETPALQRWFLSRLREETYVGGRRVPRLCEIPEFSEDMILARPSGEQ